MGLISALEVLGGLSGIAGSIILSIPSVHDLRNREFWDRLNRLSQAARDKKAIGVTDTDIEATRALLLEDMLGGYSAHLRCTIGGSMLLALGFALIVAAGTVRLFE